MFILHLTSKLIARVDDFGATFHAARMGALMTLPGNPFGVELRSLTSGVATKVRHPLLRGKNRIVGFGETDLDALDDLLRFYRADNLPVQLFVAPGQTSPRLFQHLAEAGLWSAGSGIVLGAVPEAATDTTAANIVVRRSALTEKESYLDLFQRAFDHRVERTLEYRAFQWAEDALPGGARYIAEIDDEPVGMASFVVIDGVGLCATAGVMPEYRGRGVQSALIRQRIIDAPALGCDLVLGGGSPGTTTYRNFERAGMHLIPTGSSWGEIPKR